MIELTVAEYAAKEGISPSGAWKRIKTGKVRTKKTIRNNQTSTVVLYDESDTPVYQGNVPGQQGYTPQSNIPDAESNVPVQEAEVINDYESDKSYSLVRMENSTFDQLIENIKELAEARVQSEVNHHEELKGVYHETVAKNKELSEQLEKYKYEAIQAQADLKIHQLRVEEFGGKLQKVEELENQLRELNHTLTEKTHHLDASQKSIQEKDQQLQELKTIKEDHQKELEQLKKAIEDKDKQIEELKQRKTFFGIPLN